MSNITVREQSAILKPLAAGLVPQIGLHHLVVGRKREIQALCSDLDAIKQGGSAFRVVTGPNGVGKTFLTTLLRGMAIESGLVILSADLGVTSPTGNGLRPLLETWISGLGFDLGDQNATPEAMAQRVFDALRPLKDYPLGFEFAQVINRYAEGHITDNPTLQDEVLRWLRGEFSTRTEARQALGVRRIIDDENFYDALKLFSAFCKLAGHGGVVAVLDELSALVFRLPHARARQANVQVLLKILNDCLQGGASGLGFVFASTMDAFSDPERGLFSVPALRSRLQVCAPAGCIDYTSSVLKLEPLGKEDLMGLLHNVRRVHGLADESKYRLPKEGIERFLARALSRFGRTALANPRDVLRPFVSILNVLEQEPNRSWSELIDGAMADTGRTSNPAEAELAGLKLE